ncbi:competence type IV pilus ATPase ComGA [Levilactobacillus fujinensis]|uniref:Competence type IV pilus ATPase ComGA n=1 Tax=Levilactobacillus fujinensis TaxID=2486024 RepID=A0ABW1TCI2_9LACO|nr:competence type IV pilus ATPase ComGA [Levilactobacillus fujinensis]
MIKPFIEKLLAQAIDQKVSDIYVIPHQADYQIRFRRLQAVTIWQTVPFATGLQIMTYFKFHADMAVSENRRPQVGALTWTHEQLPVELRFSTVGDYAGKESLVIRLIYPYTATQAAYLVPQQATTLMQLAGKRGLMVFAGPTGSGKTTTMYATASRLCTTALVLTIEDPVEIKESRFIQLQVNPTAGMTYADLIKVGLRHRPDVFIIGEIRDQVTAQAAVRAALSGHLVLTTVHARSAAGTISRLTELGVSLQQLRQVLTAACYQRLIPRVTQVPAVLLDILTTDTIWDAASQMTEGWRQTLEQAVRAGTITTTTQQNFRAG